VTLDLQHVNIRVGDRLVLDGVDLSVPEGTIVGITRYGTSVLDTIAGIQSPDAGRILLDGRQVESTEVGMLTQRHELLGALTAAENVAVRLLANGTIGVQQADLIERQLAALLLPPSSWHNLVEQISGGQQQRVAIARALIGSPALVCLDEPTTELDSTSRDAVWRAIRATAATGSIIFVASADADEIERCDVVWGLK
jgi:ABC-type multidrug transport system ATPase subunit